MFHIVPVGIPASPGDAFPVPQDGEPVHFQAAALQIGKKFQHGRRRDALGFGGDGCEVRFHESGDLLSLRSCIYRAKITITAARRTNPPVSR